MSTFETIDAKVRVKLEQTLYEQAIKHFRTMEHEEDVYTYIVKMRKILFKTFMTDCELRDAAHYAVELMEELKHINNSGMNQKRLGAIRKEIETQMKDMDDEYKEFMVPLYIAKRISTDRIWEIKSKLAEIYRVGGAYWMLISNPTFDHTIYLIYLCMVDRFDDETRYHCAAYFLLRGIMRINSWEV